MEILFIPDDLDMKLNLPIILNFQYILFRTSFQFDIDIFKIIFQILSLSHPE
jgi:hypothetical protein